MDKQRCRFLLRAFRPNGADSADPTFHEALEQVRLDPELGAWFSREQAIDGALAARLRDFRAPAELRQQILDGLTVSSHRTARRPVATFFAGLAAAASIALAIYTAWPTRATRTPFDSIVASAVAESRHAADMNYFSSSASDIRTWLASSSAPIPGELPRKLASLETIGARTMKLEGAPASLVTFRAHSFFDDPNGVPVDAIVQLFTVDQSSCSDGSAPRQPIIFTRDGQSVATWRDTRHFYIVAVQAPQSALRELLGSGAVAMLMHYAPPRAPTAGNILSPPVDEDGARHPLPVFL